MPETKTFELTITSDRYVGHLALIAAIEKGLKDRKALVVSEVESCQCPMCGQTARITTTYGKRRTRWWEFWRWHRPLEYHFDSDHPCYNTAAEEFADADSPWRKRVDVGGSR
jgi:hypothetical protein